jgi:hypothetical protein
MSTEIESEYHIVATIRLKRITYSQDLNEKHHSINAETTMVLFEIEGNSQYSKYYNDYIYVGDDAVLVDENIEHIALVGHPIGGAIRLALELGSKDIQKPHFVLMSESRKDAFLKKDGERIEFTIIKKSEELNYEV